MSSQNTKKYQLHKTNVSSVLLDIRSNAPHIYLKEKQMLFFFLDWK